MKHRAYIESQIAMMLENPAPFRARAQEILGPFGFGLWGGKVDWAETIPFPPDLAAERRAYDRLLWWAMILYSSPWLGFGFWGLLHLIHDQPLWSQWPMLWRWAVAGAFALWHQYAAKVEKLGVWRDLDLWEQALIAREDEFRADCEVVILERSLSTCKPHDH